MKKKYRLLPALIWLLVVVVALLTPGNNLPKVPLFPYADKLVHLGVFGLLTFLWCRVGTLDEKGKIKSGKLLTNILVFSIFFPILLEYLQMYVPNRSFEFADILANLLGGLIGFSGFIILYKVKHPLV
ncbi:MAG: VanZ family protein [Cecembia sp.]